MDQLNKILDVLGTPDEKMIQCIKSERVGIFFGRSRVRSLIDSQARKYVRSLPIRRPKSFTELIPMAEPTGEHSNQILQICCDNLVQQSTFSPLSFNSTLIADPTLFKLCFIPG